MSVCSLYIISTPIGNLKDITLRGLETIDSLDLLLCEDSKTSRTLLSHYNLTPKKISTLNSFNRQKAIPLAISQLIEGKNVGLISDAGTPLISDPGLELVEAARSHNINIVPIPGASSVLASLVASGLPTQSFAFGGFSPRTGNKRRVFFEQWNSFNGTLIIFESPHRIKESLKDMLTVFGDDTSIVVAREITKTFEEYIRGKLGDIKDKDSNLNNMKIKGEFVILLYLQRQTRFLFSEAQLKNIIEESLDQDWKGSKAVIQAIHLTTGISKKYLYDLVLKMKKQQS